MNRLRSFLLFSVFSLTIAGLCLASDLKEAFPDWDDEDYIVEAEAFDSDVADFLQEQARELQAFRDERDRDFAEFLQESWKEFSEFEGIKRDSQPKPVSLPRMKETPLIPKREDGDTMVAVEEPKQIPPKEPAPVKEPFAEMDEPPVTKPLPEPTPQPVVLPDAPPQNDGGEKNKTTSPPVKPMQDPPAKVVEPPAKSSPKPVPPPVVPLPQKSEEPSEKSVTPSGPTAVIPFYGSEFTLRYDERCRVQVPKSLDNQAISAFWKSQGTTDFDLLLTQLLAARSALKLNDWAYYRFINATSEAIQTSSNARTLFTWFLLTKSGYRVKIGYSGDMSYLLVPSVSTIYEIPFYTLGGTRYYNITCFLGAKKPGSLYTFETDYPGSENTLSLALPVSPKVRPERVTRTLSFRYEGKTYSFPVAYNRNIIQFYGEYPMTDFPVFFAANINPDSEKSLLDGLRPLIDGKSEAEAVNFVLRFVQTAFEYKTDEDQFGREKYMFAEETLAFPYSDCEDRSILFSFLVKKLVGLETVGLHFPGHMATAVRFTEDVGGDHLIVDGKRFTVCDPTYINANIGMTMPQFKGAKVEIVRTET